MIYIYIYIYMSFGAKGLSCNMFTVAREKYINKKSKYYLEEFHFSNI